MQAGPVGGGAAASPAAQLSDTEPSDSTLAFRPAGMGGACAVQEPISRPRQPRPSSWAWEAPAAPSRATASSKIAERRISRLFGSLEHGSSDRNWSGARDAREEAEFDQPRAGPASCQSPMRLLRLLGSRFLQVPLPLQLFLLNV